jgi:hypothetical protein
MLIYLAGAIDKHAFPQDGFDELVKALISAHTSRLDIDGAVQIFAPALGWSIGGRHTKETAETLISANMAIVRNADALVVRYDRGMETWGTPMEVQLAHHNEDVPIYVWSIVENSGGNRPDSLDARYIVPTYLLPYVEGGVVWNSFPAMSAQIMSDFYDRQQEQGDPNLEGGLIEFLNSLRG